MMTNVEVHQIARDAGVCDSCRNVITAVAMFSHVRAERECESQT